ncbi:glycerate kinase type-2 family protein [Aminivibrio sp.]|uniref:glycerate kinase type-2 family protein n=1 Tax=Aminivibrio sp. TaxID=1872489 RepID=UPI003D98689E
MKQVRDDAMKAALKAIEAVLPENAVKEALRDERFLTRLDGGGRIVLAAIGKAAWRMAKAAAEALGSRLDGGVAVTKYGHSMGDIQGIEIREAGHPFPDENTLAGTAKLLEGVKGLSEKDTVLFLVSGGGSALFEKPKDGVGLNDLISVTDQLLACGADIVEINMIRKRLSAVKGGRFAHFVAPAHVFAIVLSDVLGDRLDSIASGPAHPDGSTVREAMRIVEKYSLSMRPGLLDALKEETPKTLDNVTTIIAGSVTALCSAAEKAVRELGYVPLLLTTTLSCEARDAGAFLASVAREIRSSGNPLKPPCAILLGGETVVHLKGKGMGGRNQELALAAAAGIRGLADTAVISVGSDGTDGPTDAAGGLVDGETAPAISGLGLDLEKILADNDSYHGLDACGCLVRTGPTGTNVNDLTILLCR